MDLKLGIMSKYCENEMHLLNDKRARLKCE